MRISDWSSDVCSSDLGYLVAILGDNSVGVMGLGWPWWLTVPVAILGAALFGTLIGLISVRTEGIYTIMITLAIAVAFFYFVRQNYDLFNGFKDRKSTRLNSSH